MLHKPAKKLRLNRIARIPSPGRGRFMSDENNLTAAVRIGFLTRWTQGHPNTIFLIRDNLSVHRSWAVRAWLAVRCDRIEVFYRAA